MLKAGILAHAPVVSGLGRRGRKIRSSRLSLAICKPEWATTWGPISENKTQENGSHVEWLTCNILAWISTFNVHKTQLISQWKKLSHSFSVKGFLKFTENHREAGSPRPLSALGHLHLRTLSWKVAGSLLQDLTHGKKRGQSQALEYSLEEALHPESRGREIWEGRQLCTKGLEDRNYLWEKGAGIVLHLGTSFFVFISWVWVFTCMYVCTWLYMVYAWWLHRDQKTDGCKPHACCEPSPGLLQEQYVLLIAKPSVRSSHIPELGRCTFYLPSVIQYPQSHQIGHISTITNKSSCVPLIKLQPS